MSECTTKVQRSGARCWVIWGLVFFLVAVLSYFCFTGRSVNRAISTFFWSETTGTITETGMELYRHRPPLYIPIVHYTFDKGEKTYNGEAHLFIRHNVDMAQIVLDRYPEGSTVPVYYDPANPEMNTLEYGFTLQRIFHCLITLSLFAAGIAFFCIARCKKKKFKLANSVTLAE